jgi:hypothetical protein
MAYVSAMSTLYLTHEDDLCEAQTKVLEGRKRALLDKAAGKATIGVRGPSRMN